MEGYAGKKCIDWYIRRHGSWDQSSHSIDIEINPEVPSSLAAFHDLSWPVLRPRGSSSHLRLKILPSSRTESFTRKHSQHICWLADPAAGPSYLPTKLSKQTVISRCSFSPRHPELFPNPSNAAWRTTTKNMPSPFLFQNNATPLKVKAFRTDYGIIEKFAVT